MEVNPQILQQSFKALQGIHKELDFLDTVLSYNLGGPTCIPGCGRCCHQSFAIPQISAIYIASHIQTLPKETRKLIISRLEKWLRYKVPDVRGRFSSDGEEELRIRVNEYRAIHNLSCPFLGDDSRCLIYPWRPINCRAWGVTRPIGTVCPRPIYKGETKEQRKHSVANEEVSLQITALESFLNQYFPQAMAKSWLPTLVYLYLKPIEGQKLEKEVQEAKYALYHSHRIWLITPEDVKKYGEDWSEADSINIATV